MAKRNNNPESADGAKPARGGRNKAEKQRVSPNLSAQVSERGDTGHLFPEAKSTDGQEPAEITYTDIPDRNAMPAPQSVEAKLAMVAVSGGIGVVSAIMFMLWLRGGRRRVAARSVGAARAA